MSRFARISTPLLGALAALSLTSACSDPAGGGGTPTPTPEADTGGGDGGGGEPEPFPTPEAEPTGLEPDVVVIGDTPQPEPEPTETDGGPDTAQPDGTQPDGTEPDGTEPDAAPEPNPEAEPEGNPEPTPDAEPEAAADLCLNEADLQILTTSDVQSAATSCGLGCLGQPDPETCSLPCIVDATGLSATCSGCWAGLIGCTIELCLGACAGGTDAPECITCQEASCYAGFEACSGLDIGTPNPEPEPNPEAEPEANPEPNPEAEPEANPEPNPEAEPEANPEPDAALCVNDSDLTILEDEDTDLSAVATNCGLECFGEGGSCTEDCIVGATGLSAACAGCYADAFACGASKCTAECQFAPQSEECSACVDVQCGPALAYCALGEGEPPAPSCAKAGDACDPAGIQPADFVCLHAGGGAGICAGSCLLENDDCGEAFVCTQANTSDEGVGFCAPEDCTGFDSVECGPGAFCLVQGENSFCLPLGPSAEGDPCVNLGQCGPGLLCFDGTCAVPDCAGDLGCGEGELCQPIVFLDGSETDVGLCFAPCQPYVGAAASGCPEGEMCVPNAFDASIGTCEPLPIGGGGQLGESCAGKATGCCLAQEGPGCKDADVEGCVCAVDPFCCDTEWDQLCADETSELGCKDCLLEEPCGDGTFCVDDVCQAPCDAGADAAAPGACGEGSVCVPLNIGGNPIDLGLCVEGCLTFTEESGCLEGDWCAPNIFASEVGECTPTTETDGALGDACGQGMPCGADLICVGGTCGDLCVPGAETGLAACQTGETCSKLFINDPEQGTLELAVGVCNASCDYHKFIACPEEEVQFCAPGELLGADSDTCLEIPDFPGWPLEHGDPCPPASDYAFCSPGAFCLPVGGGNSVCTQACFTSEGPFDAPHPDCPDGSTCVDAFGLPEMGLCVP